MIQLGFWILWLLVGYAGASAWLGAACPPGACNFLLVLLQLPQLVLPMFVWLFVGIGISVAIAKRKGHGDPEPTPLTQPSTDAAEPPVVQAPASNGDPMKELGITFDGKQYQFNGYRYDRLSDAVSYARIVASRGNA